MSGELAYREFPPSPEVGQHVRGYWALHTRASASRVMLRSLPLGLPELIVTIRGWVREGPRASGRLPVAVVSGQATSSRTLRASGELHLFGVCFTPTGSTALLEAPAQDLVDRLVEPAAVSPLASRLAEQIAEAPDDLSRAALVDATLSSVAGKRIGVSSRELMVERASRLVDLRSGLVNVDELARELGASSSSLERAFALQVGVGPKELAQLVRFRRVLGRIESARQVLDLAFEGAFSDQSHLTREFHRRVGMPPGRYLRVEKSAMEEAILASHVLRGCGARTF